MKTDRVAELLHEALKHEYTVYVDDALKYVGFLMVALGWLLTSETARKALQARIVNAVAAACMLAVAANTGLVLWGHYLRSCRIQEKLLRLAPETRELVVTYAITPGHVLLNALALGALVIVLFVFIIAQRTRGAEGTTLNK
jgi:hypothetical protein